MNVKQATQIQIHFFQKIKNEIKDFQSIAGVLSEILNLSMDSAYRRVRGETLLSLSEIMAVCDYFKITFSYNTVDSTEESANFFYKTLCDTEHSVKNVLKCLYDLGERLKLISAHQNASTILTMNEIPVFYIFEFKELTLFRMKIWLQEMNDYYDNNINDEELLSIANTIYTNYSKCNLTEIWSHHAVHNLTSTITYYYEVGDLDRKEAHLLLDQTKQLMNNRYKNANTADGKKYNLYWSELELSNSFMLSIFDEIKISTIKLFSLSSISTYNKNMYDDIFKWISNIKKNAALISGTNRKKRAQFFNYIDDMIAKARDVIDS